MCDTRDEKDRKEPPEETPSAAHRDVPDAAPLTWECARVAEMDPDEFYISHGNGD
ncbi:MAG TPA: hypothetical protein VJJ55_02635 [Candidatus Paceibacterota bacterium]